LPKRVQAEINYRRNPEMIGRFSNPGFYEKWAFKKYSLKNAVLYITGSSSALLSRGIGTALTGRYLDIEVFPLNLK
jgi:hypothetical protein